MGNVASETVVERLATAEGTDPMDLEPPLYDAIDLETLDALVQSTDQPMTVEFTYNGYTVRVDESATVTLVSSESVLANDSESSKRLSR